MTALIGPGYSLYSVSRLDPVDGEFIFMGEYQSRSVLGAAKKALKVSPGSFQTLTELPKVTGTEHPHRHTVKVQRGSRTQYIELANLTAQVAQ